MKYDFLSTQYFLDRSASSSEPVDRLILDLNNNSIVQLMPKFHTCNKRMKRCAVLKSPFLLDISSSLTHLVTSSIIFKFSSLSLLFKTSEVTQSCLTLCDPMDCSLPGSSVHGIFQARVLEWGAPHLSLSSLHIIASVTGLIQYSYHFFPGQNRR